MQVQRTIAQRGRVIAAGRDIGTVVLPDADLKIYIDASLEARALRRYQQRIDHGEAADLTVIMDGLQARDQIDSSRDVAPLRRALDAIYLDTTTLNFDQSVEAMQRIINEWTPVKKLADNR
jgi:cytidylate kinase